MQSVMQMLARCESIDVSDVLNAVRSDSCVGPRFQMYAMRIVRAAQALSEVTSNADLFTIVLMHLDFKDHLSFALASREVRQCIQRAKPVVHPFASMTKKQALRFADCNLWRVGTLNLTMQRMTRFEFLAKFAGLETLTLNGTCISDLTHLKKLTELKELGLCFTKVVLLSPLQDHVKLRHLQLIGTDVTDVSPLAGLTSLVGLYLGNISKVANRDSLSHLNALRIYC